MIGSGVKSLALVCSVLALGAQAQQVCPTDPAPRCRGRECACHPALLGDPVNMMTGRSSLATLDVSIDTGVGLVEIWRYLSSSQESSSPTAAMARPWHASAKPPFGTPVYKPNPIWSSNIFSYVDTRFSAPAVFDGALNWLEFTNTTLAGVVGGYGFLRRIGPAGGLDERLERTVAGGNEAYRLVLATGEQLLYQTPNVPFSGDAGPPELLFLSEVRTRVNKTLYTVNHSKLSANSGVGCVASSAGAQHVTSLDLQTGLFLFFDYQASWSAADGVTQCVLRTIRYGKTPDAGVVVAMYDYAGGSSDRGRVITFNRESDSFYEKVVPYSSSMSIRTDFWQSPYQSSVLHSYDPQTEKVWADAVGGTTAFSVSYPLDTWAVAAPEIPWASQCASNGGPSSVAEFEAPAGTPDRASAKLYSRYFSYADYQFGGKHSLALRARQDRCDGGWCSPGYVLYTPGSADGGVCSYDNPQLSMARRDKRGSWTIDEQKLGSPFWASNDHVPSRLLRGADSESGSNALEVVDYEPALAVYSPVTNVRLASSELRGSALVPNGITTRRPQFDGSDFMTSVVQQGYTKRLSDAVPIQRTRSTVYKKQRLCSPSSSDPHGRVLRIEGPCAGLDCSVETVYPVLELFYYDQNSPGFDSGRLWKVVRYPEYSTFGCGRALTTEYAEYTVEGMPRTVIDESGVSSAWTYSGTRIASRAVAGRTTTYSYGPEGLRNVKFPEGNFEVYCYWADLPSGGCNFGHPPASGQRSERPRWRAKSATADGSAPSEKVIYEYWPNWELKREVFLDSTGTSRRVMQHFPDLHGRPTFEASGENLTSAVVQKLKFDGADNLVASGSGANFVPDFCTEANGAASPLCSWMHYDRADRIYEIDLHPSGFVDSTSITQCIDYDRQGNVRRVARGCDGNSSGQCSVNQSLGASSTCSGAPVDYDVDDFGDVIRVRAPWSGGEGVAETAYEYDVRGNLIKMQTSRMKSDGVWLAFGYDQLNRRTSVVREGTGGSLPLYYLTYDVGLSEPGCPSTTNTGGRLASRWDSFGKTWFSYDEDGRIIAEIRQRTGSQGSCPGDLDSGPHTFYRYTDNGNLREIQYPHGRIVTYQFGSGGLRDRVSSVSVALRTNGAWASTPLVEGVVWEPFGPLRGYRYVMGNAARGSVEYVLNGSATSPVSTGLCSAQALESTAPDGAGRVRALWVSSGSQPLGGGSGDVLKQFYTWRDRELTASQTCFTSLGQSSEHRVNFAYDSIGQLVGAAGTGMPARLTGPGSAVYNRTYAYDSFGNRSAASIDSCDRSYGRGQGGTVDLLHVTTPNTMDADCLSRFSGNTYLYDDDGRVNRIATAFWWWSADFNYEAEGILTGGLESVFKSVSVSGAAGSASYHYFYDAFNRRRIKSYPFDAKDEFFHGLSNELLSSVGSNRIGTPTSLVVDDYVWLGGRMVALIRGGFVGAGPSIRKNDDDFACSRLGEAGHCGVQFVLSDQQSKPVMSIERATGLVTSASLYDEFGNVNRVPLVSGVSGGHSGGWSASASMPQGGMSRARMLYNYVDLLPGITIALNGQAEVGGRFNAHVWSDWVGTQGGILSAGLRTTGGAITTNGAQTDLVEYQRYQRTSGWGSSAAWKVSPSGPAGWAGLGFDDSAWAAAVEEGGYGAAPWYSGVTFPTGTPARWIWSYDAHDDWGAGPGTVYFRKTFVSSGTQLQLTLAADDSFEAYLDGVQIRAGSPWTQPFPVTVEVAPGVPHVLAVVAVNGGGPAGLLVDAVESSTPVSFPMRFPGQFHDPETELFANWNRFYDPSVGRYLSPEPLLKSPTYVRRMAESGMRVPTYAYAANNPMRYADPDGLRIVWNHNDAALNRQVSRLRSTRTGAALFDFLDERPQVINLRDLGPIQWREDGSWLAGGTNFKRTGEPNSRPNGDSECSAITHRSLERARWTDSRGRRWPMDPAAILGHELVHAMDNIFDPTGWSDETYPLEIQERIQAELEMGP